jgi:hypothetical protein
MRGLVRRLLPHWSGAYPRHRASHDCVTKSGLISFPQNTMRWPTTLGHDIESY